MAFVPAPQIVQAEVRALLDNQNIENRFMIDVLTAVTPAIVAEVANIVNVWAQAQYFDHIPDAVRLIETVATDMSAQNGSQHTIPTEGTFVGGLAGVIMPNEVTFCITHKSASRGRSARGRSYILGVNKASTTGNVIDEGLADALVADFDDLRDRITTAGWSWVVVSYIANKVPRPGGPVYFPITSSGYADLLLDSMKKRKPGVGT